MGRNPFSDIPFNMDNPSAIRSSLDMSIGKLWVEVNPAVLNIMLDFFEE
jgi:hypothetical protein